MCELYSVNFSPKIRKSGYIASRIYEIGAEVRRWEKAKGVLS